MSLEDQKNKHLSLAEASQLTPYSQEYLSLRARQGKLKAVKVGRDWITTKEWLDDYLIRVKSASVSRKKQKGEYISLREAAKHTKYSQEYLSLRVRQGKIKAVKLGRNWATTKEWVDEYAARVSEQKVQKEDVGEIGRAAQPESDFAERSTASLLEVIPAEEFAESVVPIEKLATGRLASLAEKFFGRLGNKIEQWAIAWREVGVCVFLRFKAIESALEIWQTAPALAREELKYFKTAALIFSLALGSWFLTQPQLQAKLGGEVVVALEKVGELTLAAPQKISGITQQSKNILPATRRNLIFGAESFKKDLNKSWDIIKKRKRVIVWSSGEALNELNWQARRLGAAATQDLPEVVLAATQKLIDGALAGPFRSRLSPHRRRDG